MLNSLFAKAIAPMTTCFLLSVSLAIALESPIRADAGVPVSDGSQTTPDPSSSPAPRSEGASTPESHSVTMSLDVVDETYTLGAGDRIHIEIFNVPEYTGEKQVLVDGSISMPLVGEVSVRNLTLGQTADAIAVAYGNYLRSPIVTVNLVTPRPLRVAIAGEVNRPGSYDVVLPSEVDAEDRTQWPTVTRALQLAGGITPNANVRQIKIQRSYPEASPEVITLDLWTLLESGDLRQDLTLRDGDTIVVSRADSVDAFEATQLASASFSPDTIQINVVGEVITPGAVEVPPNTPLNQALLAAGGFDNSRARRGSVELIRLNPDGSVSQRTVDVDLANSINDETNPILHNNDVVIVGRSGTASFSDAVDGVLETLGRIFPVFGLF